MAAGARPPPSRCTARRCTPEDGCEYSTYDHHAAAGCWLSTVAIFRQPSILRNLIYPVTTRLKSKTRALSSLGTEPCVLKGITLSNNCESHASWLSDTYFLPRIARSTS